MPCDRPAIDKVPGTTNRAIANARQAVMLPNTSKSECKTPHSNAFYPYAGLTADC